MKITRQEVQDAIDFIRSRGQKIRFSELRDTCTKVFGSPRIRGSHHIFKMPWGGSPRVNIQPGKGGKAKGYQVQQVLEALYYYRSIL